MKGTMHDLTNLIELFAIVNTDDTADHFGHNNHIA